MCVLAAVSYNDNYNLNMMDKIAPVKDWADYNVRVDNIAIWSSYVLCLCGMMKLGKLLAVFVLTNASFYKALHIPNIVRR